MLDIRIFHQQREDIESQIPWLEQFLLTKYIVVPVRSEGQVVTQFKNILVTYETKRRA